MGEVKVMDGRGVSWRRGEGGGKEVEGSGWKEHGGGKEVERRGWRGGRGEEGGGKEVGGCVCACVCDWSLGLCGGELCVVESRVCMFVVCPELMDSNVTVVLERGSA